MHRKLWTKESVQKSKRVSNLCKSTDTILCHVIFLDIYFMRIHHGWCNLSGTRVLSLCCSFLRLINNEKKTKQNRLLPPTTPLLHHSHALTHKNPPTIFQNDRQSILQTQVQTNRLLHACLHLSLHQRSSKLVPVGTSAVLSEAAFLGHKQCLN